MICDNIACGCAVISDTLVISGSGTPSDPWRLEQAQFTDITALQVDVANIQATLATLPGTYVDVTGDSMSGELSISNPSGRALKLVETVNGLPFLDFRDGGNARCGYLQGRTTTDATPGVRLAADNNDPVRLNIGNVDRVTADATRILYFKTASATTTQGLEMEAVGGLWATRTDGNAALLVNKTGAGGAVTGTIYCDWRLSNTTIGTISRNAATSAVLYNVSSDANLKTVIGDLDPELAEYVLALVTPMMYSWNEDPDHTPAIGYIAQHVAEAWPESVELGFVTPGVGDVADRTWDSDGNETTPDGVWRPWQMDPKVIIPLLHASLVRTTQKLSYLRAEHDDLVARVEALELIAKPKEAP